MTRHNHRRKNTKRKPPVDSARLGTAMIHAIVSESQTREGDRVVINAIKDSVWYFMNTMHPQDDKVHWATAGILAAYNLGRWGAKNAVNKKKVETP